MKKILYFFAALLLLTSCSLKYEDPVDVESKVPELVFENLVMSRYEDNAVTFQMSAGILEQYKDSNESFAKDIDFKSFEKDGTLSTEGSCGLLMTDTKKEIYEMYDDIKLSNHSENTNFYANVLKWDAKSEQLISSRGDMVKIEKDDTVIRGTGFSASGISKDFSFRGTVTGDINTK